VQAIREVLNSFVVTFRSRWFWRFAGSIALIDLAALVLLGLSFFLVIHATLMMLFRVSPHFSFARRFFVRISPSFPLSQLAKPVPIAWPSAISLLSRVIVWLILVAAAAWILANLGLCGQNPICAISSGNVQ